MDARTRVRRAFDDGTLDTQSLLTEVPGVGPYLEGRLRRALLQQPGGGQAGGPQRNAQPPPAAAPPAPPLTVGSLATSMRGKQAPAVVRILQRALQNRRANQCVPHSPRASPRYHAGDVNEHGFEAVAAVLDEARRRRLVPNLRYASPLPRPRRRSAASRECGCRPRAECRGRCRLTSDGTACVPADNRVRGFPGVPPHPDQVVTAATDAERAAVRRRAHTPRTRATLRDVDSAADVAAGHAPRMAYDARGRRVWRRPSPKVRLPVTR